MGVEGQSPFRSNGFRRPTRCSPTARIPRSRWRAAKSGDAGSYFVVITNFFGSVTSSVAALTILPPPQLHGEISGPNFQFTAFAVPGDSYWIQAATNLEAPVIWTTIATNVAAPDGLVQFSEAIAAGKLNRFYRLVAP